MAGAGAGFLAGSIIAKMVLDKTGWNQAVQSVGKDAKALGSMTEQQARNIRAMGFAMTAVGAIITATMTSFVKAAQTQMAAERQLNAVLESTKGVAGLTAEEVKKLAASMQSVTTYGDEAILVGQNLLLTFTNIGKDVFPAATETMLDMSTALGQDLKSSAIQLGKALQDPVLGVTALRRVGVNFNDEQREIIKTLVESGRTLEAQKIILAELATEFGGSARAAALEFGGQMKQLKNEVGDVKEELGRMLIPILQSIVGEIKPIVISLKEWIKEHPGLAKNITIVVAALGALMTILGPLLIMLPGLTIAFNMAKIAMGASLGPMAAVTAGALALGAGINYLINRYKAKQDAEMAAIVKNSGPIAEAMELRKRLIKEQIVSHEEWREIFNKHGRDYSATLNAIATDPSYAKLRGELEEIRKEHEKTSGASKGLKESFPELREEIERYAKELNNAKTAEKEFSDFLSEIGLKTIAEKQSRISDLLGYQARLDQMLKDNKITLEDYKMAIAAISKEFFEFGEKIETAVLPARDLLGVLDLAPSTFEDVSYGVRDLEKEIDYLSDQLKVSPATIRMVIFNLQALQLQLAGIHVPTLDFSQLTREAETTVETAKGYFDGLYNDIASGWANTIQQWVEGSMTFRDLWKSLWEDIKNSFFRVIGEMAAKWAIDLVKGLVNPALDAGKSITSTLGSAVKGIGTGIKGLLTGLGEGIAGMAKAIAGAAKEILIAAGVALAIFAGFKIVEGILGKVFGGGGKESSDVTYWLKLIQTNTQNLENMALNDHKGMLHEIMITGWARNELLGHIYDLTSSDLNNLGDRIVDRLGDIIEAIENIAGAQSGAIVTKPSFLKVAEKSPEAIIPLADLPRIVTPNPSSSPIVNLNNYVSIDGTMITDRDYTRQRFIPELIEALNANADGLKSKLQTALGVA